MAIGVVYRKINASAWDRLDRFEGEMYARLVVRIELIDGSNLHVITIRPQRGIDDNY